MRMTRTGPDATNPAALRCGRVLFWVAMFWVPAAIAVCGTSGCRSDNRRRPERKAQTQRRRQVLRRGRPSMAPKSPLTPSLRACPEGLPTWSLPEGPDRGLALAGCPAVPRSRRSASRLPARPKAPRLPTSTAEAAWPFRLRSGPEGPALRLKRRSPEGFRRFRDRLPCGPPSREWILLRSRQRSNKKLHRVFEISVDNQAVSGQMPCIFFHIPARARRVSADSACG